MTEVENPMLTQRYSGRAYEPGKLVSKEDLGALLKAASLAPSCYNEQPWRFLVCDKQRDPEAYAKAFSSLVEANQKWVEPVPLLIVAVASLTWKRNGKPNRWAQYDTGAAAFALMVEGTTRGMMVHQMGGFNKEQLHEQFAIPEDCEAMAVIAVGYATAEDEQPPRERDPMAEHFFEGKWGKPV